MSKKRNSLFDPPVSRCDENHLKIYHTFTNSICYISIEFCKYKPRDKIFNKIYQNKCAFYLPQNPRTIQRIFVKVFDKKSKIEIVSSTPLQGNKKNCFNFRRNKYSSLNNYFRASFYLFIIIVSVFFFFSTENKIIYKSRNSKILATWDICLHSQFLSLPNI